MLGRRHFGRQVISAISPVKLSPQDLETIYDRVYRTFVMEIDAIDNGVLQYPGAEGSKNYSISSGKPPSGVVNVQA